MGRWKEAVSSVQRSRKNRYWMRIGWEARKLASDAVPLVWDPVSLAEFDRLDGKGGKGGGGDNGNDGEDGVAFSIRAQVR